LNKKVLRFYDFKVNKFVVKLNKYYDLLNQEKFNEIDNANSKTDHIYNLFNIFLKKNIDSDVSFTFYYFKEDLNKKKLKQLSYLVGYEYLYKKIKKGVLSDLTKEELYLNYKNFYMQTIQNNYLNGINDMFNMEGNEPFLTPARSYKKFRELMENDDLNFITIFNDINSFDIDSLKQVLIKAFNYLDQSDIMFSINADLLDKFEKFENKEFMDYFDHLKKTEDYFDYTIIRNDLNLALLVNKKALTDNSFLTFLKNIKYYASNVTENIFNLDIFDEDYKKDVDVLNLFLKSNFFYLDYFSIALNSKKYSLCYLLFLFKVLKNIQNYELYYNNNCKKKIKKYNNIVFDYHKHIFNRLEHLTNTFNSFIKYKANTIFINLKNFDNMNYIKKLKKKNFTNIYIKNIKDNIKLNYGNRDKNYFLDHFNKYKYNSVFEKKEIKMSKVITFDEFIYGDIDIKSLSEQLLIKQYYLENFMRYYKFKDNELINFEDIGLYLYNIKGFEECEKDIYLFFEYKVHKLLDFNVDDFGIYEKLDFQKNYSILYFQYIIKLFKNLKIYISSTPIENLVFDDNFFYKNFDNIMNEKRVDFLANLDSFLKLFKTIQQIRYDGMLRLINSLIFHYGRYIEFNDIFNYSLLYDSNILKKVDSKHLYELEVDLDNVIQVWYFILERLEVLRKQYASCINLLKLEKLQEFFDYPMFSNVKGFILLKEAYFNCLEGLIIEDRALDHAFNISMCLFRTFDKHVNFLRHQVMFKNGIMSKLIYLLPED
jgi:hypothetical protein